MSVQVDTPVLAHVEFTVGHQVFSIIFHFITMKKGPF